MTDTFRKVYTPLTDLQKEQVAIMKENAEELLSQMNKAVDPNERSERSRCMAIARTNLETTIMWAVKAITTANE